MELTFECEFFNPDGSTGMMCGNGGRAITRFAEMNGYSIFMMNLEFLMAGDIYSKLVKIKIMIKLNTTCSQNTLPQEMDINLKLNNWKLKIDTWYSNTGTHHLMIDYNQYWDEEFREFDIEKLAIPFRHHDLFKPDGVNVNFYKIKNNKVELRTFEKGVELETGACGTGAVATALTVAN